MGALLAAGALMTGCNDYLDVTPPSDVTPEVYFKTPEQLAAYTINYYTSSAVSGKRGNNAFPHHGIGGSSYETYFDDDMGTDNEFATNDRFYSDKGVQVGATGGYYDFYTINEINYFLQQAKANLEAGTITGDEEEINHYIGEGYVLRAIDYFKRLCALGDFPIVTECQDLDREKLISISKRQPRNEVARFIIANLDTATTLLSNSLSRNRITRDVAYTLKARVALYEATFEKYFAGTPFVPDKAAGWPGAQKEYNANYSYDNAAEVSYFLGEAMSAAKQVIQNHPTLVSNNKKVLGSTYSSMPANPYYDMFASKDVSGYDEVLMYRSYDKDVAGGSCLNQYIRGGRGWTQEFCNAFLMENGLPIYDPNSGYGGDDYVADTKTGRDYRWQLFMKAPGEYLYEGDDAQRIGINKNKSNPDYLVPIIYTGTITTNTGYTKGKGWTKEQTYTKGGWDETAAPIFRSAEAYLIYIEAAWEKYGDGLDADAWTYWGQLRERAGLPSDPYVTINATDLDQEEYYSHDFGLYSAGQRITSKVLYNIRRERRCELMGEGMRYDDLVRWRALDQLIEKPYYLHGCKIFGPMLNYFPNNKLKYDQAVVSNNNVSSPSDTEGGLNGDPSYWSLMRVANTSKWYDCGMTWHLGHYLNPIAENHFLESSTDGVSKDTSPLYQNPYFSTTQQTGAEK